MEKTALDLFNELLLNNDIKDIASKLMLHVGTLRRWVDLNAVPPNYYNELNRLLDYKYEKPTNDKDNDCYFTKTAVVDSCLSKLYDTLTKLNINPNDYIFLEPSAGAGAFFNKLPDNKLGFDINPLNQNILKKNYLDFIPEQDKKYIVVGNPPFGLRGNLALQFINKSAEFADVIAFILPPLFNSDGKGSPKKRVNPNWNLIVDEIIDDDMYEYPDGSEVKVKTIFQIWTKLESECFKKIEQKTCNNYIKVYSLSDGGTPSTTRNKDMQDKCDVYIPSTCFLGQMKVCNTFEELPHRRGYGVVFLKDKVKLKELFDTVDLYKYAFKSTNSAVNMRTSIINQIVIDNGMVD